MAKYVDKQELLDLLEKKIKADNERRMAVIDNDFIDLVNDATVISDMVEVDDISEQIIRKKSKSKRLLAERCQAISSNARLF